MLVENLPLILESIEAADGRIFRYGLPIFSGYSDPIAKEIGTMMTEAP